MNAESAYLFRHALLRDAAYQLQLPGDRARLHGFAFDLIQSLCGGGPPTLPDLASDATPPHVPHPTDPFARELAGHARLAGRPSPAVEHFLRRAAEWSTLRFQNRDARDLWLEVASMLKGNARGRALRWAAIASFLAGLPAEGIHMIEEALAIHRASGHRGFEAIALGNLGGGLREVGRVEEAEKAHLAALAGHRETGNRLFEGAVLTNLSNLYRSTGRREQGESSLLQALDIFRGLGDRKSMGIALCNLGLAYLETQRLADAERVLAEGLALSEETGDLRTAVSALGNSAIVLERSGRLDEAERVYERSLELQRTVGDRRLEAITIGNLGGLCLLKGDFARAERLLRESVALHRQFNNRRFEGIHQADLATVLLSSGRGDEARDDWRAASAILREVRDTFQLEAKTRDMREACLKMGVPGFEEEWA